MNLADLSWTIWQCTNHRKFNNEYFILLEKYSYGVTQIYQPT